MLATKKTIRQDKKVLQVADTSKNSISNLDSETTKPEFFFFDEAKTMKKKTGKNLMHIKVMQVLKLLNF